MNFSVAKGAVELPPADQGSVYTIQSIILPSGKLKLVEAAKNGQGAGSDWMPSGDGIDGEKQKAAISDSPLDTFGLYMKNWQRVH